MLNIENLSVHYGGIHALQGVSLEVPKGKIVTLIGANGAGKSTSLKAIIGLVKASSGKVNFDGQATNNMQTKDIVRKGLVLAPEGRRIFPNLSVEENLNLGAFARKDKAEISKDKNKIYDFFPRLKERIKQRAGTLSGGEQQMLAVGRALMSRPRLLMLDEPSLGLAPLIVKMIFGIIKTINQEGVTILLVEQNAKAALEIADYAYVLETGRISLSGKGSELLADDNVRKAYLGES